MKDFKATCRLLATGILAVILLFGAATAASAGGSNVLIGMLDPANTNYTPLTFKMWIATRSGDTAAGNASYAGSPSYTNYFSNVGNFSPSWVNGETVVAITEKSDGRYSVINLTLDSTKSSQVFANATLQAIPAPTATGGSGQVALSWTAAVDSGSGNIAGYNIYRDTSATGTFATKLNGSPVAATSYNDTTGTYGTTYYYKIKIVFRGAPNTVETTYFSAASAGAIPTNPLPTITTVYKQGTTNNWANVYDTIEITGTNFGGGAGAATAPAGSWIELRISGTTYVIAPDDGSASDLVYWWQNDRIQVGVPHKIGATLAIAGSSANRKVKVVTPLGSVEAGLAIKPKVYGLRPSISTVGGRITIEGTAFSSATANNTIRFNGTSTTGATATVGASITTIEVIVPSLAVGTYPVTVEVASQQSNANFDWTPYALITLTVNPLPTVTSASPTSRPQGATANVTVNGTNFQSGAAVTFSGTGLTVNSTTFVNATQLTVNLSVGAAATAGARNVIVTNPDGGSATGASLFTINAKPTVTSASPSSRGQGFSGNVTVNGTNFVSGATAAISGTGVTVNSTTFVSATQLTVNLSVAAGATAGARSITVTNPDTGTGSGTGLLTITAAPTVTSTSPNSGYQTWSGTVTVNGAGFVTGATASFNNNGVTVNSTTFVSATQLTANITIGATATLGTRNVTVTNPDGGNATGASLFTVTALPAITTVYKQGTTNNSVYVYDTIEISGANFGGGAGAATAPAGSWIELRISGATYVIAPDDGSASDLVYWWQNDMIQVGIPYRISSSIAAAGDNTIRKVRVVTPIGSTEAGFAIKPKVNSVKPTVGTVGGRITIEGTALHATAASNIIRFNGTSTTAATAVQGTSISTIEVIIPNLATGTYPLSVEVNSQLSNTNYDWSPYDLITFTVNALPTVTSASPTSRPQGATANVTVNGTNFQSGAAAAFSGTGLTVNSTTFVNATQLTANITIASGATVGARNITVTNPDGGTAAGASLFTVNARPTVTSATPATREQISTGNVTVNGTGFVSGATVAISGTGLTVNSTTFVSATQLTVNLSVAAGATLGTRDITVTNPDTGTGTGTALLTITVPTPVITGNVVAQGTTNNWAYVYDTIEISGTNFGGGTGSNTAPAGSRIELIVAGSTYSIAPDDGSANDLVYWWQNDKIQVGIPYKLGATITVAGDNTARKVKVVTPNGSIEAGFAIKPKISTSLMPTRGQAGTMITIEGTAFSSTAAANTIKLGSASVTASAANAGTSITTLELVAPNIAVGTYPLTVEVAGQGSNSNYDWSPFSPVTFEVIDLPAGKPLGFNSTRSENNAILTWNVPAEGEPGSGYRVYRGISPTDITTQIGGLVPAGAHTLTDTGAIGTADSYYYIVKSVSGANVSAASNIAVVAKQALTYAAGMANKHWISLPYKHGFTDAKSLLLYLNGDSGGGVPSGGPVSNLVRWDPASQRYESATYNAILGWVYDPGPGSFAVNTGEGFELTIDGTTTVVLTGAHDPSYNFNLTYQAGRSNKFWISLPQENTYTTGQELINSLNGGNPAPGTTTNIVRLNGATQLFESITYNAVLGWLYDPGPAAFPIVKGEMFEVTINANTIWQPSVIVP